MSSSLRQTLADINQGRITAEDTKPTSHKGPKTTKARPKPAAKAPAEVKAEDAKSSQVKAAGAAGSSLAGRANGVSFGPKAGVKTITAAMAIKAGTLTGAAGIDPSWGVLAKRVKDVLVTLEKYNGSRLSPAQILEETGLDLETDTELMQKISRHERIQYEGGPTQFSVNSPLATKPAAWYCYRPEIVGVRDKVDLLNYIRDYKGPALLVSQLSKCYLAAEQDLHQLRDERRIFIISQPEAGKDVVYTCDMMGQETVAEDVRNHWFKVCAYEWIGSSQVQGAVPFGIQELQEAVVKAGLRSALANQPVKRAAPGAPRERKRQRTERKVNIAKATNAHMPQLFAGAQPVSLDGR